MPNNINFVPAICPQCGAQLKVNPDTDAAVCEYCNTPFVVEKAINKYNITNHIQNTTIVNRNVKRSIWDYYAEESQRQSQLLMQQRQYDETHPEEKKKREQTQRIAIIATGILVVFLIVLFSQSMKAIQAMLG